jgi:hypothetical protein
MTESTAANANTVPTPPAMPNCRTLAISATPRAPNPTAVVSTMSTHADPTVTSDKATASPFESPARRAFW